jgi:aminoglycoside phosphotransferase (APT) family kinase protein
MPLKRPWTAFRLATAFADAHVALHRLPVDGFPGRKDGPSVERQIEWYRTWLGDVATNKETFEWLDARKNLVLPEQPSVTHTNYIPANVMVDDEGRLQVIDWAGADVGDRHGDVADALVFMRTEPIREPDVLRSFARRIGRSVFVRRYLSRYTQQYPLDMQRLRYWEALRAFAWRWTVAALLPTALERHDIAREPYERQIVRLEQYLRRRQREFDATS